jgi:membrane protein DedA with SNARE-associated domain
VRPIYVRYAYVCTMRLVSSLVHYVLLYGVSLIFVNVILEQLGMPVPAAPALIVAGALSRDGKLSSTNVLLAALLASLIADYIWFLLGRRYGYRILRVLCRISLSPDSCVRDTEARFERWGLKSLLIAKFIPGFSTVAPPLAGAAGHGTLAFVVYDGIGALIWAGAAVAAGRTFHRAIDRVLAALENLGGWALLVVACLLLLVIAVKWAQRVHFLRQLRLARIKPEELKAMLDRGEVTVVLDVRSPGARKHDPRAIPTAILAHIDDIDMRLGDLAPHQEVVLYCT